jgi:periplasmic copper chaperone A
MCFLEEIRMGLRWLFLSFFVLTFAVAQSPALQIQNPWVRLVPNKTTAAYMVITNPSARPIRIMGFSAAIATRAELHQTQSVDPNDHMGMDHSNMPGIEGAEVTGMREVKEIVVPARGKLELKPGGTHLMLVGLKQTLSAGQKVRIVLRLEGGRIQNVDAVVKMQ